MQQNELLRRAVEILEEQGITEIDQEYVTHWVQQLGLTEGWQAVLKRMVG